MTPCGFPPSYEIRKSADPLAPGHRAWHHVDMSNLVVHIDRSLRLAVSDESGRSLAALRLTRSGAEGLADALLEFAGNRVRSCSNRTSVRVGCAADINPHNIPQSTL